MGIYVERDGIVLPHLNIELLDTVFTEDTEYTAARILTGDFDDIVLRHP